MKFAVVVDRDSSGEDERRDHKHYQPEMGEKLAQFGLTDPYRTDTHHLQREFEMSSSRKRPLAELKLATIDQLDTEYEETDDDHHYDDDHYYMDDHHYDEDHHDDDPEAGRGSQRDSGSARRQTWRAGPRISLPISSPTSPEFRRQFRPQLSPEFRSQFPPPPPSLRNFDRPPISVQLPCNQEPPTPCKNT